MRCCKECDKRQPACQDYCEPYRAEVEKDREQKAKIREAKEKEVIAVNTAVRLGEKRRRRYAK